LLSATANVVWASAVALLRDEMSCRHDIAARAFAVEAEKDETAGPQQ
jgi:hypothetical protein